MRNTIHLLMQASIEAHIACSTDTACLESIEHAAHQMITCLQQGGKILIFGNGGSAADSQHIAAELVSRFKRERQALPCLALTTDTSILTAIANDYTFDRVFARQIEAIGTKGDIALGITTSGSSANIHAAFSQAHQQGLTTIALTSAKGSVLSDTVDTAILVPVEATPSIQQCHSTIGHILCELIEQACAA